MNHKIMLKALAAILLLSTIFGTQFIESVRAEEPPIEIWTNYTLHRDIVFSEDGFIVKADGIMLNLNGHTIRGSSLGGYRGIKLIGRKDVSVKNGVIKGFYQGVFLQNSHFNAIENLKIGKSEEQWSNGIHLLQSNDNIVEGNTVYETAGDGIICPQSHRNVLRRNVAHHCKEGIDVAYPDGAENIVEYNIAYSNVWYGIHLHKTCDNLVRFNIAYDNQAGIKMEEHATGNIVKDNHVYENGGGIDMFFESDSNMVVNNLVENNQIGVGLIDSVDNTITENTVRNNQYGIRAIRHSDSNRIFHNNLGTNTIQAYCEQSADEFDDGYPSGGNYWSDYKKRYPHAEELDKSGIWDTPYVIDSDNQDNFPLIKSWTPPQYELFVEIDYMTGHKPTESVLTYIKTYYLQRSIDVTFYVDDEVAFDSEVTKTEFFTYEATYNDLGDDKIVDGNRVMTSKWKWVLFGTVDSDGAKGYTYATTEAGNYIFVADETNDDWANEWINKYIWGITEEEVETVVLMHEMGHGIGILKRDKPGTHPDGDGTPEDYDNAKWSVMALLRRHNYNANPIRYSQSYWNLRNMEY